MCVSPLLLDPHPREHAMILEGMMWTCRILLASDVCSLSRFPHDLRSGTQTLHLSSRGRCPSTSRAFFQVADPLSSSATSHCAAAHTCGVRGIGQVATPLGAHAEMRLTRAFGSGKARQGSRGRQGRNGGLELTVREQQGRRVKHENEGEMERYDMRTANTLSHACTRCLCVTQRNCV